MDNAVIQLLVLAGVAIFLILRLRSVLGTREGFEKPPVAAPRPNESGRSVKRDFEVIEGGIDRDIADHVEEGSDSEQALTSMKSAEPSFMVGEFLQGARGAYEMILMAFEASDLTDVETFLSDDVQESFEEVIRIREEQGVRVEANFVGVREVSLVEATFDENTGIGEVTVRFVGELTSVVKNAAGDVIEGNATEIKRQKDIWTFGRKMGDADPNWQLVATGG